MKRIFVRGVSRSGGTLMATVLDAHPDVAMCYEVYEHLIAPNDENDDGVAGLLEALDVDPRSLQERLFRRPATTGTAPDAKLTRFIFRAQRGGVDRRRLASLLAEHVDAGRDLATFDGRMQFIERLALEKARRENKRHWGAKITSSYADLRRIHPDARFLFMLRDGRDIAASRKNVGDFQKPVGEIAAGWIRQIELFQRLVEDPDVAARFVRYEDLVTRPEPALREIMEFLGLPWSKEVLRHDQQDLTIFHNPTGHLSGEQVRQPIGSASVGRWRTDLTAPEVADFESVAAAVLAAYGYGVSEAS